MKIVKIKEHYFNYDNVGEFDFEIREYENGEKVYLVNVLYLGVKTSIILTEEEYTLAEERLEFAIINNFVFIDLLIKG